MNRVRFIHWSKSSFATPRPRLSSLLLGLLVALLLLALFATRAMPLNAQVETDLDAAIAKIAETLDNFEEQLDFSGVVLIARGDEILFEQGYGYAVVEFEVENQPDTVFRVASISKQFTGMAIAKLAEEGLLDVDESICTYLPRCPEQWNEITVLNLLTHTSGLPFDAPQNKRNPALAFPLGKHQYSNFGYNLLAEIVTSVSGVPFRRYLKETFFDPLGMNDTNLEVDPLIVVPRRAEGYLSNTRRSPTTPMANFQGSASAYSSAEDLLKWERALETGQVISQESFDEMWRRAVKVDEDSYYGYGIRSIKRMGQDAYFHGGIGEGYRAQKFYLPEHDITYILLSNRENDLSWDITDSIFQILFPETE